MTSDYYIFAFDISEHDVPTLGIGRPISATKFEMINIIQGKEAEELYNKLIKKSLEEEKKDEI